MKNKIKKWHIALMSFLTLFVTIFASLFSLRADTVDEETGEIVTDNWELGVVFYDSTVNNGKTALTEINWDASDGGHAQGTPRVITVQINYKNSKTVTSYQPGELNILIPNLIYSDYNFGINNETVYLGSYLAKWNATAIVGANDNTHTGYDWNFITEDSPTRTTANYAFENAITIEEGTNFEGSIQIQYTITPVAEVASESQIERYEDFCIHSNTQQIQATLFSFKNENIIASTPQWPENVSLSQKEMFWEYTDESADHLSITFSPYSSLAMNSTLYIYDKENNLISQFAKKEVSGKSLTINGNYIKIKLSSKNYYQERFAVYINGIIARSEIINFNYTRTYNHPWEKTNYEIKKTASLISSYDGLGENPADYIWVKYDFGARTVMFDTKYISMINSSYPYIGLSEFYFEDQFPEECIIIKNYEQLTPENNKLIITNKQTTQSSYRYEHQYYVYVGYPKSIYNDRNNNLIINNTVKLYGTFANETENCLLAEDTIQINLANFEFVYNGELYGVDKSVQSGGGNNYYQNYTNTMNGSVGTNSSQWYLFFSSVYTGKTYTLKTGDDLLLISRNDGNYSKLTDEEYYFSSIEFPALYDGNSEQIPSIYDVEVYVRYSGNTDFELFTTFKNPSSRKGISFGSNSRVVDFYCLIKDLNCSISKNYIYAYLKIDNTKNIATSGKVYNFNYLQIYMDGILQNEPTLDSYANLFTKELIAQFDQETYGTYMQRAMEYRPYSYYEVPKLDYRNSIFKEMNDSIIQDEGREVFKGTTTLAIESASLANTSDYASSYQHDYYIMNMGASEFDPQKNITGFEIIDLLPEGMLLTSSSEEILESLIIGTSSISFYKMDKTKLTNDEVKTLFLENSTIEINKNWNNTNRTRIYISFNLTDNPIAYLVRYPIKIISLNYSYEIPYDSFLEFGAVWENRAYMKYIGNIFSYLYRAPGNSNYWTSKTTLDNGKFDPQEQDINSNQILNETLCYSEDVITINSIVSTHQDVTKYVKTNMNTYSTGTVNSDCDSEYEYKLRVRTGAANVTNLILYDNLETAQPQRQRWQGEFLEIDTSFAETKTYKLHKPNDPNADSNGYISYNVNVKPYYSENPLAGNLYNEDGTLNSDWKEYIPDTPVVYAQGLEIKFNSQFKTEDIKWDYIEIYYVLNETIYKLGKWGGTDLAGQTIQKPTNDFYLYWHTNSSNSSHYGFSIDSIINKNIENTNTTTGTIPNYTPEEIKGDIYPDSAFESYTHGNYGNNINKVWHYTYTGDMEVIQEYKEGTDKTKVKSLAFEYLDNEGNPAILPAKNLTYNLIKMKSPADESITTLARNNCRTQWNAIDDFEQPVDFITGINSNVVKVALPNSVDEDNLPSVSLKFRKEIQGTGSEFEKMKLNMAAQQTFMIRLTSLTENDDGSYNQVTALLKSDQELIISRIPIGTYLLEELSDNYFDFVEFVENNEEDIIIEGVTFERTDQGYIITVSEDLTETVEFNIKVTNEIEPERFYEDKENKENIFLKNKIEENS